MTHKQLNKEFSKLPKSMKIHVLSAAKRLQAEIDRVSSPEFREAHRKAVKERYEHEQMVLNSPG